MINFTEAQAWCADMKKPDAWKGTTFLTKPFENRELDCCLGRYCKLKDAPRRLSTAGNRYFYTIGRQKTDQVLPAYLQEKLDIDATGSLTSYGRSICYAYFGESRDNLASINDTLTSDDATLFRMACFIEWCIAEEQLFGRECFLEPI